jgi:ribosome-associated protein
LSDLSSSKFASITARMLDNKLAKDITILNISNVSVLADYFVICSADATTQVRALTGFVRTKVKELFDRIPIGEEMDEKGRWNLLDYGDVIIHILHKEEREFYALEKFWNHACTINSETWMQESEYIADKLL